MAAAPALCDVRSPIKDGGLAHCFPNKPGGIGGGANARAAPFATAGTALIGRTEGVTKGAWPSSANR
eukprot:2086265-Amphidinium_carterae.1